MCGRDVHHTITMSSKKTTDVTLEGVAARDADIDIADEVVADMAIRSQSARTVRMKIMQDGPKFVKYCASLKLPISHLAIGALKTDIDPKLNKKDWVVGGGTDFNQLAFGSAHSADGKVTVMAYPLLHAGSGTQKVDHVQVCLETVDARAAFAGVSVEDMVILVMKLTGDMCVRTQNVRMLSAGDPVTLVPEVTKAYAPYSAAFQCSVEELKRRAPELFNKTMYTSKGVIVDGQYATRVLYPRIKEFGAMTTKRMIDTLIYRLPGVAELLGPDEDEDDNDDDDDEGEDVSNRPIV